MPQKNILVLEDILRIPLDSAVLVRRGNRHSPSATQTTESYERLEKMIPIDVNECPTFARCFLKVERGIGILPNKWLNSSLCCIKIFTN